MAPEGKIILIPASILLIVLGMIALKTGNGYVKSLFYIDFIFVLFSLYFFRDPVRTVPEGDNIFVSPADGKIVQILDVNDSDIGQAKQISIFLSVFNVHSQCVPFSANVLESKYNKGKFLAAYDHKASLDNEQTEILFETTTHGKFKIKQIAGLIARRILNYMMPGMKVKQGDRLGFIRFGSRVDILVSGNFNIQVQEGDIVTSCETIIGNYQ
tara:strand:+ start:542 stop:1180 length:639 start_codon:yes stop_codon:yes gene_type:complete